MIILCGHGQYGEALKNSVEMIAGTQEKIKYVNFTFDMSVTDIIDSYNGLISNYKEGEIMIGCDLPGGSPANAAILVKREKDNVRVFTGVNLPMVLSLVTGENIENSLANARMAIAEVK